MFFKKDKVLSVESQLGINQNINTQNTVFNQNNPNDEIKEIEKVYKIKSSNLSNWELARLRDFHRKIKEEENLSPNKNSDTKNKSNIYFKILKFLWL